DGEVLESVGAGVVGRGAAAVAAQVEGDGAGGRGDAVGDGLVQPAAEAVGVQQHDRWPVAAPVECPDGDAGLAGEVDDLGWRWRWSVRHGGRRWGRAVRGWPRAIQIG